MKVSKVYNNSIFIILMLVLSCCMIILFMSMFNLPDIQSTQNNETKGPLYKDMKLSKYGEMMLEMLPNDLAFTVFMPSEEAFDHYLKLRENDKFDPQELSNNVYATVSHVLGFGTVPRKIYAGLISDGEEVVYDSISGFGLYVSKGFDGVLVVNGVRAKFVDVKRGEVVVHVMDGVIMDAEFELSVRPDDEGDDVIMQG